MTLEGSGNIPFAKIGDSAFPRYPWLLTGCNENTSVQQQHYFNKKLCSVRVVTENAYGMLKDHWRKLYKKTERRLHNLKYHALNNDYVSSATVLANLGSI